MNVRVTQARKIQENRATYAQKYYTRFSKNTGLGGVSNMGYYNVSKKSGTKLSDHFTQTNLTAMVLDVVNPR